MNGIYLFSIVLFCSYGQSRLLSKENSKSCGIDSLKKSQGEVWTELKSSFGVSYCVECQCNSLGIAECKPLSCPATKCETVDCCSSCTSHNSPQPNKRNRIKPDSSRANQNPGNNVVEGDFGMFLAGSEILSRIPKNHGCFYKSKFIKNEEVFPDESSTAYKTRCSLCVCMEGDIYCRTKSCPRLRCRQPTVVDGDCCLACPSQVQTTRHKVTSSTIQPPIETQLPCVSGSKRYQSESKWKPQVPAMSETCVECECKNGNVRCRIPKCPELECSNPISSEDRCCKVCPPATSPLSSTLPPSDCQSGLELLQYIPIPENPQKDRIDFSFRLNETFSGNVTSRPVGIGIAVRLPQTFLVYEWLIDEETNKRRQVMNMRAETFQKFEVSKNKLGSFRTVGFVTKKRLEIFRRKETRWSTRCRRRCGFRLKRILKALASSSIYCAH
nr:chordin-like protein 1 [Ciona intestinalis]|eukprot:XP_002120499.1 chordin-like protein 1 [Ciona intestinalis]